MQKTSNIEIERKFLVTGEFRHLCSGASHIKQAFLSSAKGRTVRVRIRDERAFLTIKGPSTDDGLSRYEWEREIGMDDALAMMQFCEDGVVEKTRHIFVADDGHTWEIDEFYGANQGLVVAEVELASKREKVKKPHFIGREVTGDRRYYNSCLRREPYRLWCPQQEEGRQTARLKLPSWYEKEGIWYPARLAMEQCSSEATAAYKRQIVERLVPPASRKVFADVTGGFGVDFTTLAPLFAKAIYAERQSDLASIVEHNLEVFGVGNAECKNIDGMGLFRQLQGAVVMIDPARRDANGRKVVMLEDCEPSLPDLQAEWAEAQLILAKLSPMLDITHVVQTLRGVREVHAIGLGGECKELLVVIDPRYTDAPTVRAINLPEEEAIEGEFAKKAHFIDVLDRMPASGDLLFEPCAAVLKANLNDTLAERHQMFKLHPNSNLYITETASTSLGRTFEVEQVCGFGKADIKALTADISQANITVRNFPQTVAQMRKRLRLGEGGNIYLFATTVSDGSHVLLRCKRIKSSTGEITR